MQCPRCLKQSLNPTELETGLICGHCDSCQGTLLPLLNYRHWLARLDYGVVEVPEDTLVAEDNTHALICQKCQHLMTKYRIDVATNHRLDYCGHCDEVWLDDGEWPLLKQLDHHYHLPHLITEVWQNQLRHQESQLRLYSRYRDLLGDESFEKVREFKEWLQEQDDKQSIRQFLLME